MQWVHDMEDMITRLGNQTICMAPPTAEPGQVVG